MSATTPIPFDTPASETGFVVGVGTAWHINARDSLDLGYRSHDTRVLRSETLSLQPLVNV